LSDTKSIVVAVSGGVALLTLDRPQRRNAMSRALVDELIVGLSRLNSDPTVRAIVLTGREAGFCAGSDLVELASATHEDRISFEAASGRAARMLGQISKPTIAAVHGFAIGGGLTLAASCDLVVAEPAAKWSLPETAIGLFPAWGLNAVEARIGRPATRRLCWGVNTLGGEEAYRLGLVDILAPPTQATDAAMSFARQLAALPADQCAAVKEYFSVDASGEAADVLANRLFARVSSSGAAEASFARFRAR